MDRSGHPQGVYSHSTALSLYELSDVNPAKIHMTVPVGFRRRSPIPKVLRLRFDHIPRSDRRQVLGVVVTSPRRTLVDVVTERSLSDDILKQAVREALARGLVTHSELADARVDCPALEDFLRGIRR
jgi:predicted transcriptional regulator of viral defense system